MFVVANFLIALSRIVGLINFLLSIYVYVVVFRALISWVNPDPYNPIVQFLNNATEPILNPIRNMMFKVFKREMWIDFSPVIAIFLIYIVMIFLDNFLAPTLVDFAWRLK